MSPFPILFSFTHIFLLLQLASFATAQPNYAYSYCSKRLNYTMNSTYRRNLNSLLSNFSSDTKITDGFYNLSVGNTPNQVNGIAICRGDIKLEECRECIHNSTIEILQDCPNQIEAILYYGLCMLRFTNRSIFGVWDQGNIPTYYLRNGNNVTSSELDGFNQGLQSLLMRLRSTAAAGDSTKKFATGSEISGFYTIYGLMQCTPDLSSKDCENCLVGAVSEIPIYMPGNIGGRVMKSSCILRFETARFYENTSPPPPASSPPAEQTPTSSRSPASPPQGKSSNTGRIVIIIIVSIAGVVILIIICVCVFFGVRKPKRRLEVANYYEDVDQIEDVNTLQIDFETIRIATTDFSDQNKLGQGGFGAVYKGTFPNGQEIAVKRLSKNSGQGDLEFKNEVLLVAKLQHRNLVRLLGFCLEGTERLLIYEFVPNTSLDYFLFDPIKRACMDWDRRHKIIGGIAKGLLYLHEDSRLRIIHRDMKASNILLDEDMNPKIADFGMARMFVLDQTQGNTNRIVGTYGYMAPEYAMHGHFSVKSDVYSFGVLILEILSGQKNSSFRIGENVENLLSYAWKNWREGTYTNVVDPHILAHGSTSEIMRCMHIGLLCVQENVAERPTMASVVVMLNSYSLTLSVPSQPAFFIYTNIQFEYISSSFRATHSSHSNNEILPLSKNDVSITEQYPR